MPSPMRSNHPSVRIESSETMRGTGIAEDRVSCESVTKTAFKTRLWERRRPRGQDSAQSGSNGRTRSASACAVAAAGADPLVQKSKARSALAKDSRSLRDLGQRGDAAANASQDRARLLRALDAALPYIERTRGGSRRRRAPRLARSGLLFARAAPALGRT